MSAMSPTLPLGIEDEEDCPLCMEEMDPSDRNFRPCPCGYQVCRFCWHRLREEQEKGKCPACRRPYTEDAVQFTPVPPEELDRMKQKKRASKEKREGAAAIIADRQHLSELRVIQRNLVYVIGVSMKIADEKTLREPHFFGQFGKITKIVVNKKAYGHGASSSASAYITYTNDEDAKRAIEVVDGSVYDGRVLRATYGTTKYCSFFLRGLQCSNSECLYLHELGNQVHSFTKEQMSAGKHHLQSFLVDSKESQAFKKFGMASNLLPSRTNNNNINSESSKSPPPPGLVPSMAEDPVQSVVFYESFIDRFKRIFTGQYTSANARWFSDFLRSLSFRIDPPISFDPFFDDPLLSQPADLGSKRAFYTKDLLLSLSSPTNSNINIVPEVRNLDRSLESSKQTTPQPTAKLKFETKKRQETSSQNSSTPSTPSLGIKKDVTPKVAPVVKLTPPTTTTPTNSGIKSKNIFYLLENEEPASISEPSSPITEVDEDKEIEGTKMPIIDSKSAASQSGNTTVPAFKMTTVKRPVNLEEADRLLRDLERRSEKSKEAVKTLEEQVKASMAALSLNASKQPTSG